MHAITVGMKKSMAGWRRTPDSELGFRSGCKGEQAGFPGSRGACRGWGERVCLGALCTVAVDVPFVTGEILGCFFFFLGSWWVNSPTLGDKPESLFCV